MPCQYITATCHIHSNPPLTVPKRIIVIYDKARYCNYQKRDLRIVEFVHLRSRNSGMLDTEDYNTQETSAQLNKGHSITFQKI